jgi:hypothetical protein
MPQTAEERVLQFNQVNLMPYRQKPLWHLKLENS